MKTFVTLALAAVVALTFVGIPTGGTAHAQGASRQVAADVSVTVIIIRDYIGPDDFQQVPQTYRFPSAQTLARAQEEIRSNPAVRAALEARGIAFRNVSGVQTAWSGDKIVYVR